jgi:hypothetical protein
VRQRLSQRGLFGLGIDISNFFFEHPGFVSFDLPNGRGHRGPAHVITVVNAPYMNYVLWLLGGSFLSGKFVTGYWAWEQPTLPEEWDRGFDAVHEVKAPSQFVAAAITARRPTRRVDVASHPVALESPPFRSCHTGQAVTVYVRLRNECGFGIFSQEPSRPYPCLPTCFWQLETRAA